MPTNMHHADSRSCSGHGRRDRFDPPDDPRAATAGSRARVRPSGVLVIAALLAVLPLPAVIAQPDRPSAERARAPQPRGADATDPAEVRIDAVQVRGSLSVSVVRRAIERIRPMLSQCYHRHAAALAFDTPTVRVNATIDEVGRVRSPNVEGDAPPALNACLVKATTKIVTEAPDTGVVRASWKLRF